MGDDRNLPDDVILDPKERMRNLLKSGDVANFSEHIPLKRYFRSASEMYRMASIYQEEDNLEDAFILYTRYVTLLVERAPKHPDYKTIGKEEKTKYSKNVKHALDFAEKDKKVLKIKFESEAEQLKKEKDAESERLAVLAAAERARAELDENGEVSDYQSSLPSCPPLSSNDFEPLITDTHGISYPEIGQGPSPQKQIKPSVPQRNLRPQTVVAGAIPLVDRSIKPTGYNSKYGLLRDIIIPSNLPIKFMQLAERNTERNVETCGILCGKLAQNKFVVTHVIVPKQSGTPDSCTTEKEEEVFDIQDKHDLITVGWIHTHPTQTAFLSSVDLHTHCSYQLMLPEAIAIVCSPKFNDVGVFMLTPDHGMNEISNCRESGFHPHRQEPPLFEVSPHAQFSEGFDASVVDLRN